jgi:hypothetical protein
MNSHHLPIIRPIYSFLKQNARILKLNRRMKLMNRRAVSDVTGFGQDEWKSTCVTTSKPSMVPLSPLTNGSGGGGCFRWC